MAGSGAKRGRLLQQYVPDYVVFDLETTGISCQADRVVEISGIRVADGKALEEYTSLVQPGCPIPAEARRVHGITDEMVADARTFDAVLAEFLEFAGGNVLVGHNIHTFDLKFLYRDCEAFYGREIPNDYVDTLTLARLCLPSLAHHRLTDLAEYYGLPTEGAHRALNDCRMNRAVYERLGEELSKGGGRSAVRTCPRCGGSLLLRKGRFGRFYGCSAYPACRYTENIE